MKTVGETNLNEPRRARSSFRNPILTRKRMAAALIVALVADTLQIFLGPAGWTFFDEVIDVIAMVLTVATLGFHVLLLPTFIIELIPVADMLPTWTGCVIAVIALNRRRRRGEALSNTSKLDTGNPPRLA